MMSCDFGARIDVCCILVRYDFILYPQSLEASGSTMYVTTANVYHAPTTWLHKRAAARSFQTRSAKWWWNCIKYRAWSWWSATYVAWHQTSCLPMRVALTPLLIPLHSILPQVEQTPRIPQLNRDAQRHEHGWSQTEWNWRSAFVYGILKVLQDSDDWNIYFKPFHILSRLRSKVITGKKYHFNSIAAL